MSGSFHAGAGSPREAHQGGKWGLSKKEAALFEAASFFA
jgi:hypothetical protein